MERQILCLAAIALLSLLPSYGQPTPSRWSDVNQANAESYAGNYAAAASILEASSKQLKGVEAEEKHLSVVLNNLGDTYAKLGRFKESETALRQSLTLTEKVYGTDSADVGYVLNTLGSTLTNDGLQHIANQTPFGIASTQSIVSVQSHRENNLD